MLLLAALLLGHTSRAQVGIGTPTPDASAALEIQAAGKGLLLPRVSLAGLTDAATVPAPAAALLVFNTNAALPGGAGFYYNAGTPTAPAWTRLNTGTAAGDNLGNHTATTNLLLGANALTGTGASISGVGVGVRADGGLNLGQNTAGNTIALGYQAGRINTGSYNLFSGTQSGYRNTTGNFNLFSGTSSGFNSTTGDYNLFSGFESGYNNTTGGGNQFSGYQSGFNNTTGNDNLFSGSQSGYNNISGSINLFSGTQSGYRNTTGNINLFSGVQSGYRNTTGSFNLFSGYLSGYSNETGNNNLFSGYQSGYSNTTGSNNTALGYNSGPTSGSGAITNATALGANVALTTSNTVVLGNGANVGIGTSAPGATLDVRRGTAPDGAAAFWGTARVSHFSYSTTEDTYIRGGKASSNVLLNDNGGNVGVRNAAPNSGLQVSSSLSVPFRTVFQSAGAYVNVTASDDDHTLRSGSPNGVVGGAVFSFLLPNPAGRAGRLYVLLNYGGTPVNLYANNGATPFATNLIYDDGTAAYLTQMPANARLTLQSDGGTWVVTAR